MCLCVFFFFSSRRRHTRCALVTGVQTCALPISSALFFKISLAEWSVNRALFGGQLYHRDFPLYAKENFGIDAVEYVNQFFMDKATDQTYLGELKTRCDDNGIRSVLIMCDREGDLGDVLPAQRKAAVENHYKWVEAAQFLGCHDIRVNAAGVGEAEEVARCAAESLTTLATFASDYGISDRKSTRLHSSH